MKNGLLRKIFIKAHSMSGLFKWAAAGQGFVN